MRYLRPLCLFLAGLSGPFLCSAEPLTEAEIRAWATGKDPGTLIDSLVTVSLEAEKLNRLLIEERRDWMEYKTEVRMSLDGVRIEMKTAREALGQSVMSFEEALRIQAGLMDRIKRESLGWKILTGISLAGFTYLALTR